MGSKLTRDEMVAGLQKIVEDPHASPETKAGAVARLEAMRSGRPLRAEIGPGRAVGFHPKEVALAGVVLGTLHFVPLRLFENSKPFKLEEVLFEFPASLLIGLVVYSIVAALTSRKMPENRRLAYRRPLFISAVVILVMVYFTWYGENKSRVQTPASAAYAS